MGRRGPSIYQDMDAETAQRWLAWCEEVGITRPRTEGR
jgi:hypothetical protein